jgi:VanZ family protein
VDRRSFGERIRPWIPALLWLVVIACESTGLFSSENTARWLWQIVTSIFGPVNPQEFRIAHGILRKVGHFVGYGVLGYFFYIGWRGRYLTNLRHTPGELRRTTQRLWRARWAALTIVMTFAVAALDEFHQTMLPGRTGAFRDVLLDTLGGIFAQWLVFMSSERKAALEAVPEDERVI